MKQLNRLLMLLLTSLLLWNCRSDLTVSENQERNTSKIKIFFLNKKQIQNVNGLLSKINKIESKNLRKTSSKSLQDSLLYGATIDTESAVLMQNEGKNTYTFKISRDSNSPIVENLVLKKNADSTFSGVLLKYNFTPTERQLSEKGSVIDLTNKVSVFPIENLNLSARIVTQVSGCYKITWETGMCGANLHDFAHYDECRDEVKPKIAEIIFVDNRCISPQPAVSVISEYTEGYDTTVYYGPSGGYVPESNPCEKILTSTNDDKYKNNITSLEGTTNQDHENGFRLGTPVLGTTQTGTQNQFLQNKPGTLVVDMSIFPNTFALMHTHYDSLNDPMLSPEDLWLFNKWIVWAKNYNDNPSTNPKIPINNLTLTVVTSQGNYMFSFDGTNIEALPDYTQDQYDILNDYYIDNVIKSGMTVANVSGSVSFDMEKIEENFLKFIQNKMNMTGLKLYKVNSDGTNTQLYLENNHRKAVPCP